MSSEPSEAELLRRAIENRLLDVHTQIPAVVESWDKDTNTIDARVTLKRAIASDDEKTVYEELPILRNIPVMYPKGGGFCLTFPLKQGDPVRLVFDEQYAGDYRETGNVPAAPVFAGRFNLSSCVAHPGGGANKDALIAINDEKMILGFEGSPSGGPAQIHFLKVDDTDPYRIYLGPDVSSRVALASPVADILSQLIHTIRTATASGTETGLASIITALNLAFGSTPEVRDTDVGAERVYAQ